MNQLSKPAEPAGRGRPVDADDGVARVQLRDQVSGGTVPAAHVHDPLRAGAPGEHRGEHLGLPEGPLGPGADRGARVLVEGAQPAGAGRLSGLHRLPRR